MTKIRYTLPPEFVKAEYIFDLHMFLQKYENCFDENLYELVINVEIHFGKLSEQVVNVFEVNNGVGMLTIPFNRYYLEKGITDLPSVKEFYSVLEFAIDKTIRDYGTIK